MCKMKILLKAQMSGGHYQEKCKTNQYLSICKILFERSQHNKQPKWMRHRIYDKTILHFKEM